MAGGVFNNADILNLDSSTDTDDTAAATTLTAIIEHYFFLSRDTHGNRMHRRCRQSVTHVSSNCHIVLG
jgi:hypothetical protein